MKNGYQNWGFTNSGELLQEPPAPRNDGGTEIHVNETKIVERIKNRIYFYSDIERSTILQFNKELKNCDNEITVEKKSLEITGEFPIIVQINSYGGALFHGMSAMDNLLRTENPVNTVVDGICASAATLISIVGKKRLMLPHSLLLIHQLSGGMWGTYADMKDQMKNSDMMMDMIKTLYGKYTRVPSEKLDEILSHDLYFNAQQCLEYGIIDEIL